MRDIHENMFKWPILIKESCYILCYICTNIRVWNENNIQKQIDKKLKRKDINIKLNVIIDYENQI